MLKLLDALSRGETFLVDKKLNTLHSLRGRIQNTMGSFCFKVFLKHGALSCFHWMLSKAQGECLPALSNITRTRIACRSRDRETSCTCQRDE